VYAITRATLRYVLRAVKPRWTNKQSTGTPRHDPFGVSHIWSGHPRTEVRSLTHRAPGPGSAPTGPALGRPTQLPTERSQHDFPRNTDGATCAAPTFLWHEVYRFRGVGAGRRAQQRAQKNTIEAHVRRDAGSSASARLRTAMSVTAVFGDRSRIRSALHGNGVGGAASRALAVGDDVELEHLLAGQARRVHGVHASDHLPARGEGKGAGATEGARLASVCAAMTTTRTSLHTPTLPCANA
jgi:hypothetical protein